MLFSSGSNNVPVVVNDQGSCAPRTYIDAEKEDDSSMRPWKAASCT
jgi:hypothetical protein